MRIFKLILSIGLLVTLTQSCGSESGDSTLQRDPIPAPPPIPGSEPTIPPPPAGSGEDTSGRPGLPANQRWIGTYFQGTQVSGIPLHTDTAIAAGPLNFNWGSGSPSNFVPADNFSVRYTTFVSIQEASAWKTFQMASDDGLRAYLVKYDNNPNNIPTGLSRIEMHNPSAAITIFGQQYWQDGGMPATGYEATTQVQLTRGSYQLVVEFYEHGGLAGLRFNSDIFGGVIPPPVACRNNQWTAHFYDNSQIYDQTQAGLPKDAWGRVIPADAIKCFDQNRNDDREVLELNMEDSRNLPAGWNKDYYTVFFIKQVNVKDGKKYDVLAKADDAVSLYIGGQHIISSSLANNGPNGHSKQVRLNDGLAVIKYQEYHSGASFKVRWKVDECGSEKYAAILICHPAWYDGPGGSNYVNFREIHADGSLGGTITKTAEAYGRRVALIDIGRNTCEPEPIGKRYQIDKYINGGYMGSIVATVNHRGENWPEGAGCLGR